MSYKSSAQWLEARQRFNAWWRNEKTERPMMHVTARRDGAAETPDEYWRPARPEDMHFDVAKKFERLERWMGGHRLMAESFPEIETGFGPGTLACYLGSEPLFAWDTVWFKECIRDYAEFGPPRLDPGNRWWKKQVETATAAAALAKDDYFVSLPDIVESVDILAAMRGPQQLCFDLVDQPEAVHDFLERLDDVYFECYDALYDICKGADGDVTYIAFKIWGEGRTAKVQCDFAALMSPDMFREFSVPYLRRQCDRLDFSLFHLDGPECLVHADAVLGIERLNGLQWTPGAGKPDGLSEQWYPLYDKVKNAGKALWVSADAAGVGDLTEGTRRLIKRYGTAGIYVLYPEMSEREAEELISGVLV